MYARIFLCLCIFKRLYLRCKVGFFRSRVHYHKWAKSQVQPKQNLICATDSCFLDALLSFLFLFVYFNTYL